MNELFMLGIFGALNAFGFCGMIATWHKQYNEAVPMLLICLGGNLIGAYSS